MTMTDVRIMGFKDAEDYIAFRFSQWIEHHTYEDLHYYVRFIAGHSARTPETFFELLEYDHKDIIWDMDWYEGECYVDLNSIYIFEETQISELIENHIELYEYVTEKRGVKQ